MKINPRAGQLAKRRSHMRGLKTLRGTTALLAGLALAPTANAQIVFAIGIQPVCSYGYYDYAPYACAPRGFYGPGYFYNGIFRGMGPGPAGVMAMAGAAIASSRPAEAIAAAAVDRCDPDRRNYFICGRTGR
jgi:hypothetical protein